MKKLFKSLTVLLLTLITLFTLIACAPSSLGKANAKMKDLGYTSVHYSDVAQNGLLGMAKYIRVKNGETDTITVYLYKNSSSAYLVKDKYKKTAQKNEVVTVSGNWVIIATETALKDFIS